MSKLVAVTSLTLDGVMQAPGREDEDTRGGFTHGGWAKPYADEVMGRTMGAQMSANPGSILLGRRTYEDLFSYWPRQTDGNQYTKTLNEVHKYVVSRTLEKPLSWQNSSLLKGNLVKSVKELKDSGENLRVIGSGNLLQTLMNHGLVDEYLLLIHPLVLGSGTRLFNDNEIGALELKDSVTTSTGVVIATYQPAE